MAPQTGTDQHLPKNASGEKKFLAVLDGESFDNPPVWLMRQAGRYLPEYRELRTKAATFVDFCLTPELATEATLQPIRRFGFDVAILFADILLIPAALGQKVAFEAGEGPRLPPLAERSDIEGLRASLDLDMLGPVFETLRRVKKALPSSTSLIGFCGAPWTVASYMIAGQGTPDQAPARIFAYRDPGAFGLLIDRLIEASILYLCAQIDAGAEAVQIFDSWAGVLPPAEFRRWCLEPLRRIVRGVRQRQPDAKIIAFPRGAGMQIVDVAEVEGVAAVSLDIPVSAPWAAKAFPSGVALQGNLDPLALLAGGQALDRSIDEILSAFRGRPHIFNLGHGILPATPIAHVEHLLKRLRSG